MANLYIDRDTHIKPFLNIAAADTSKDAQIDLLHNQCTGLLNDILNVSTLERHTVTLERFDGNVTEIWCKDFPVISVTQILEGKNNTVYSQTESYVIEKNRVLLDGVVGGGKGYSQSKITYEAGYVTYVQANESGGNYEGMTITFPDSLQLALCILIAGMYNRKNNLGISNISIQGKSVTFRDGVEAEEFEKAIKAYRKLRFRAI